MTNGTPKNNAGGGLFAAQEGQARLDGPLADRMRPPTLDDFIGQDHLVGPGRLLRRAIQADRLSSLIFHGPPGTGKTSLACIIANTTKSAFESLNAVLAGIKDIREAVAKSQERRSRWGQRTILFVDEAHRWNKAQQDALLPWVENGTVILIGATTENPFFEVNRALVSRSRIFQLKPLTPGDLAEAAKQALEDKRRGYGNWRVSFEEGALEHLLDVSAGDARSLLNALELAIETAPPRWPPPAGAEIRVSFEDAQESIQRRAVLYDRDGDCHFDTISAFIKSLRGSDPDAALYWLAVMVRAGEDPAYIFRRMLILASEDVGMADPQALGVVVSCAQAFERVGLPEGALHLTQAALYLAAAPKSNTALSFFDAMREAEKGETQVPAHLQDPSRDKEGFGHGEGYLYPHAYRDHWAAQQYLPAALQGKVFYTPSALGWEARIRDELRERREITAAMALSDAPHGEILSWAKESKARGEWFRRLESGRSALLLSNRNALFDAGSVARHHRILIAGGGDGLLLWEALRRAPEGLSAALVRSGSERDGLYDSARLFEEPEKPLAGVFPSFPQEGLPPPEDAQALFSVRRFDRIFAREPWGRGGNADLFRRFAASARNLLAPEGKIVILQSPPVWGARLSRIIGEEGAFKDAEEAFFTGEAGKMWRWDQETLEKAFRDEGFTVTVRVLDQEEARLLTERDLSRWFDRSSWGRFIAETLGQEGAGAIQARLQARIKEGPVRWSWKSLLLTAL
ncbi:MAG: AAA family ATPase [Spirochaetaceae bacterium]|jgi:putative ATPase|nr:AAA family ATPase [Spirochaetaceae bacterium]